MKKKAKFSGQIRRSFFNFLGTSRAKSYLAFIVERKLKDRYFSFPVNVSKVEELLIILPEQPIEILYQLKNILSIISQFKHAAITVLVEENSSSFIKMIPGISIVEYRKNERDLFHKDFMSLARQFKNQIDICFLLDRSPTLPMLYFTGLTRAPVRVGYEEAGMYPFINLRTRCSAIRKYLPDKNCVIAELFGIQNEPLRMSIARKTLEEVDHLLKEVKISRSHGLIGVDLLFLLRTFGENWTEKFLKQIRSVYHGGVFLYVSEDPDENEKAWSLRQNEVILKELSSSRLAALITRTDLVIAGNTMLFGIAAVLNMPAVGFFKEKELESYCPGTNRLIGFSFNDYPDNHALSATINIISTVSTKKNKENIETK